VFSFSDSVQLPASQLPCTPKEARKKCCCIFSKKKSLSAGMEIQVQGQTSSPSGRLVERETIFYIGFQQHMLSWRDNFGVCVTCVQGEEIARLEKL
jgi:hypothetical protein